MRIRCSIDAGGFLLGLGMAFVCPLSGCGSGHPEAVARVVETPEQVRMRDQAIRDAVKQGAYGKSAQKAALRGSRQ
jgi:hypothetical protein